MNYHGVELTEGTIAEFCRRHHIRRLSLFGSILRDDFGPESDVDILVEFEHGHVPGLLRMVGIENELSELIGRKADMRTPAELSRHFRGKVIEEAREHYVIA